MSWWGFTWWRVVLVQNWPYPQSSKMRKLPIIHVNVDLPVSSFAHMFFMQNTYKIQVCAPFAHWTLTALRCVEFSDFTQLQHSGCKEKRMQRGRQIWHLTLNLAILSMKSIELVIAGRDNCPLVGSSCWRYHHHYSLSLCIIMAMMENFHFRGEQNKLILFHFLPLFAPLGILDQVAWNGFSWDVLS